MHAQISNEFKVLLANYMLLSAAGRQRLTETSDDMVRSKKYEHFGASLEAVPGRPEDTPVRAPKAS